MNLSSFAEDEMPFAVPSSLSVGRNGTTLSNSADMDGYGSDRADNQSHFSMTPMSDMTAMTQGGGAGGIGAGARPYTGDAPGPEETLIDSSVLRRGHSKVHSRSSTALYAIDRVPVKKMTSSLRLSSAIDALFAAKPDMVVMSRRDAYRAYEDSLLLKSPLKNELARGKSVLKDKKKKKKTIS